MSERETPETDALIDSHYGVTVTRALGEMTVLAIKLERERDEARAEANRLIDLGMDRVASELIDKTALKSMEYREGRLSMEMEPALEIAAAFAACARTMLGDAPNYTETKLEFQVSEAGQAEVYTFVVQRNAPGAMTPHEARRKAEAERDEAREKIDHTTKLLSNPTAVYINLRAGQIALPSAKSLRELLEIAEAKESRPPTGGPER